MQLGFTTDPFNGGRWSGADIISKLHFLCKIRIGKSLMLVVVKDYLFCWIIFQYSAKKIFLFAWILEKIAIFADYLNNYYQLTTTFFYL